MDIYKKGTDQDIRKKTIHLCIVPVAPTLLYKQVNHNSCIITSLEPALNYTDDEYASKYIIKRM